MEYFFDLLVALSLRAGRHCSDFANMKLLDVKRKGFGLGKLRRLGPLSRDGSLKKEALYWQSGRESSKVISILKILLSSKTPQEFLVGSSQSQLFGL